MATTSKAAPAKAAAAKATDPAAALIDELGSLEKELAPWAGKLARIEQLRKAIRAQTPDEVYQRNGERFVALLGPRAMQNSIDIAGLVKRIGAEAYSRFATVTVKQLQEHVKPGIIALFMRQEATGPRSLKVIERG